VALQAQLFGAVAQIGARRARSPAVGPPGRIYYGNHVRTTGGLRPFSATAPPRVRGGGSQFFSARAAARNGRGGADPRTDDAVRDIRSDGLANRDLLLPDSRARSAASRYA
jgi:hypothetical protein